MVIIDADATPNIKEVEKLCREKNIEILLVCDNTHEMNFEYARVKVCESSSQAADLYIINNITSKDILITQDYGLATIVLDKAASIINPKGFKYTPFNIEALNLSKHVNSKVRKKGKYTKIKKRTEEDKRKYLEIVESEINKIYDK